MTVKHGKPAKLVAVLSHFYTPQTLTGLHALKGRDRVVGELLVAALGCSRDVTAVPRLSALAASTPVVEDPPDYQALAKDSTAMAVVERAVRELWRPEGARRGSRWPPAVPKYRPRYPSEHRDHHPPPRQAGW